MLDPAGLRKVLRELPLGDGDDPQVGVEDDGPRRGRALVQDEDVLGHLSAPP